MTERKSSNAFAVSLIAGMAGMLLALLVAPRSGRETRQRLGMAASDLKDQAGEGLDTMRASAEDGLQRAQEIKSRLTAVLSPNKKHHQDDEVQADSVQSPILMSWDREV